MFHSNENFNWFNHSKLPSSQLRRWKDRTTSNLIVIQSTLFIWILLTKTILHKNSSIFKIGPHRSTQINALWWLNGVHAVVTCLMLTRLHASQLEWVFRVLVTFKLIITPLNSQGHNVHVRDGEMYESMIEHALNTSLQFTNDIHSFTQDRMMSVFNTVTTTILDAKL